MVIDSIRLVIPRHETGPSRYRMEIRPSFTASEPVLKEIMANLDPYGRRRKAKGKQKRKGRERKGANVRK